MWRERERVDTSLVIIAIVIIGYIKGQIATHPLLTFDFKRATPVFRVKKFSGTTAALFSQSFQSKEPMQIANLMCKEIK